MNRKLKVRIEKDEQNFDQKDVATEEQNEMKRHNRKYEKCGSKLRKLKKEIFMMIHECG